MKPDIERFKKTLLLENTGYISNAELGIHPVIKEKFLGRKIRTLQDDIEFWYKAGYDYIKLQPEVDFNPEAKGLDQNMTFNEDGSLKRKWATEGTGVITSMEDFERYRFPEISEISYKRFEDIRSKLREGMGVIGQYGDIFTMTWEMMGFENFSISLFENPALIEQLMQKLGEIVLHMFEYFAESDQVDILWYSDDISYTNALMMSPEVLRQYFFPWLKKIGDLAKSSGKPFIYHTDGILYDVFEDIIACGVNAIHPIEPKAMDIAEVKQKVGDRLCLIGHVDVDLLARGSEQQVRDKVRENVEKAGFNGGYCVGSGNSVPEYVNFENYLAMLDEVKKINTSG